MSTAVAQNAINFSCLTHLHARDAGMANLSPLTPLGTPLTRPWGAPARARAVRQESCRERGSLRGPRAVEFWRERKSPIAAHKWLSCQHGAIGTPTLLQSPRHANGPLFASGGRFGSRSLLCPGLGQGQATSKCRSQDSKQVFSFQSPGHSQGPAGAPLV